MSATLLSATMSILPDALAESRLSQAAFERLFNFGIVSVHPNIVSGAVVFARTRVPVYNLWDYLEGGDSIDDFLESFPTVTRSQVQKALELR